VQEFIKEAGGTDIRAIVIGGRVIAAMKRTGAEGDFRSNLHRGGSAEVVRSCRPRSARPPCARPNPWG
jgi:ribosomal protein S6--L-glutamate ligase